MNPVSLRLLNQQLCCPQFSRPAQVVDYMGAIQAQEYRLMRWAVGMRTRKPSAGAFRKAFNGGEIVRLHLMRGTWQLVSARDYWPMIGLCGSKALAVTLGWMHSNKVSLPEKEVASIREILVETAQERCSAVKEDFVAALRERGITMDDHRLSYHIRMAELEGVLCSGDLMPMKASYALSARKVGPKPEFDRGDALKTLTLKYFRSRQPATLEDFAWWSGLGLNDCRRGIELLGDYIHTERWRGREFYLTADCRTRGFRKGNYLLIPPYDEYLISYKSRDIVLDPDRRHRAHNNSGIFQPIVTLDGIVCGNWTPFQDAPGAHFFIGSHATGLQEEWDRFIEYRKQM